MPHCSFNGPRGPLSFKIMTFLFVDCSSNKTFTVQATDHDQALRAAAAKVGSFFVAFIKTL